MYAQERRKEFTYLTVLFTDSLQKEPKNFSNNISILLALGTN